MYVPKGLIITVLNFFLQQLALKYSLVELKVPYYGYVPDTVLESDHNLTVLGIDLAHELTCFHMSTTFVDSAIIVSIVVS